MGRGLKKGEVKDLRSTGRKRARVVLLKAVADGMIRFECNRCQWCPEGELTRSNNLDANHINKNLEDIDLANLEWLCRSCHKLADSVSAKGVSTIKDEFGYGDLYG